MPCFLVVLCTSLCDAVAGIHMSSLKSKDLPCPDCLHRTHPVKTQDDFLCLITSPQPTQSSPRLYGCYSTDLPHDAAVMRNPGTSSHNLLKALHTITAFIFYSTDMHHDATVMCSPLTITPQPAQSSPHRNCFYSDLRHDATVMCSP